MKRRVFPQRFGSTVQSTTAESTAKDHVNGVLARIAGACALAALAGAVTGSSQVITINTSGNGKVATTGPVDRRYAQIEPTHVALDKTELDPKARLELIRALESEQGFAMRPFPRGHRGLTLAANGKLEPAGDGYLNMVISEGLSAKPGARMVITDIKIDRSKIVFDLDGGPDAKHRFLRHIQIGAGPEMGDPNIDPTVANAAGDPVGSRLTLTFADHVPEITPVQIKALLAPLISFDVKSPVQAFTDTLPAELKNAILGHRVLVGMTTDMVQFAMGQPTTRTREMDGQMPFEEWIYGTPPQEVDFVRINGNRVIRLEVARDGEALQIFTKDVVTAMMTTDGKPVITAEANTRTVREGDVEPDTDRQAPAAPPSLRKPGETTPTDSNNTYGDPNVGVMRPVQFPKPHTDQQPGANPDEQPSPPAAASQPAQASYPQPTAQGNAQSPAASNSQPQAAPAKTPAAPAGSQQSPASTSQLVSSGSSAQPN
ncbi:MAG: hypothetical protein ABSA42_10210 [Terracidiphilus sp.]|jgi:hypothetical protein